MLCDQMAEHAADRDRFDAMHPMEEMQDGYREVMKKVATAPRFVLDRESTLLIHGLQDIPPSKYLQAFAICRLPFPRMWVEFEFAHRIAWQRTVAHSVDIIDHAISVPPTRLGFYIERLDAEGRLFYAHPVWSQRSPEDGKIDISIAMKAMAITTEEPKPRVVSEAEIDAEIEGNRSGKRGWTRGWGTNRAEVRSYFTLCDHIAHFVPPYLEPLWRKFSADPRTKKFAEDAVAYDLAAEWRFLLSFLTVLNSRNIISYGEEQDFAKLNRARARTGKPPLLSHRPITLSLHMKRNMARVSGKSGREAEDIQRHLVIGHLKLRKSGLWWWSPHVRGNVGDPIPRTYKVTA